MNVDTSKSVVYVEWNVSEDIVSKNTIIVSNCTEIIKAVQRFNWNTAGSIRKSVELDIMWKEEIYFATLLQ